MTMDKTGGSRPSNTDHEFESLQLALDGLFEKKLYDLPGSLRERVKQEFFPNLWDVLSADQRRSATLQLDYQNDPAMEQDRKH